MTTYLYAWYIWRERGVYEDAVLKVDKPFAMRNSILVLAENEEQAYRIGRSFMLPGDRSICKKNKYFS